MSGFDFDKRWPEPFEGLDQEDELALRNIIAGSWHEGFEITRESVANLASFLKGEISNEEYRQRTLAKFPDSQE